MYDNWEQLEEEAKQCRKCRLCQTRNSVVFGTGNKTADLMFIGEGPGADEDMQGEPFVGKAGKLMNMAFEAIGLKREEVYIANIVKCRPPSNRNPEDDEANACLNYLRNQVILVKPKIIVLLGSVALKNILGKEYGITASRGKWFEKKGIMYMPTWHPAALLRDETKKIDFIKDLKEVMNIGGGNAATSISTMVNKTIDMKVPDVNILSYQELYDQVIHEDEEVYAIVSKIIGEVQGVFLFVLGNDSARKMTEFMLGEQTDNPEIQQSALNELTNIIANSFLGAIGKLIDRQLFAALPIVQYDYFGAIPEKLNIKANNIESYHDFLCEKYNFGTITKEAFKTWRK